VLVRDLSVFDGKGALRPDVLEQMVGRGLAALVGAPTAHEAWRSLFRPSDVVGIKSNVWRYLPTPAELEAILLRGVRSAGVRPENIAVDDRGVLENQVFQRATALLNVRPMRTHHWAGVGSLIKNYIMFVPDPARYHADACADLGAIWHLPHVRGKTRLNILVMLTPQFHSVGPHSFHPDFVWRYGGLLFGVDPVAVDAVGLRIIEAKRRIFFGETRPLATPPKHIRIAAERYGLGTFDPARIELSILGERRDLLL